LLAELLAQHAFAAHAAPSRTNSIRPRASGVSNRVTIGRAPRASTTQRPRARAGSNPASDFRAAALSRRKRSEPSALGGASTTCRASADPRSPLRHLLGVARSFQRPSSRRISTRPLASGVSSANSTGAE
jgi:hypothetical protein